MDVLDEILTSLRLTGGVVIDGEFSGDFCVHAEFTPNHCAPFFPLPDRLIAYHYVRSGKMIIEVDGEAPVALGPGSVAILPRNDPHLLAKRSGLPAVDKAEIMWITDEGVHRVSSGTGGEKAEVWCGFLGTSKSSEHPLLDALPPLLTLDVSGGEAQWLDSSMRFLAEQSQSPEMVARLAELFVAQAIREYVDQLPPGSTGWLRGLADPAVSKALSIIHTRYAEDLDVEGLAREAGVSRTVLGERFGELIGEPPMRYCARWRMRVASNMLREGKQNTANIGYSVGFNSEAAFNRAFKREFGEPPVTWRRRVEAEEADKALAVTAASAKPRPSDTMGRCEGRDGSEIAYAVSGSGFPVFKAPNWMTHLEHDWTSPVYGSWYELATDMGQLVRMDLRGFGMSDREPREFTFDAMVEDMKAVADAAGIEQCDLIGVSHGGAFAIAFAGRYPERVRKLVLVNSFAAGWRVRADPEEIAWRESLLEMNRRQPSFRRSLLGEMFITLYFPSASDELIAWHNEHFATLGPVANMQPMIELASLIDVREELAKIEAPTLVFHADKDGNAPISVGRQVAEGVKGARFIELESANHVLLGDEPAWEVFERETRAFLGDRVSAEPAAPRALDSIGNATSKDGVRIAFATSGEGFPVVKAQTASTNLEHDRANPVYGHWVTELSRSNRLVRFDMRGFGMSQRDPEIFSMGAMVDDLAAVVDASGLDRFDLVGLTHGAAISIAYAARYPERVRKLFLLNSFAAGWRVRGDEAELALRAGLSEFNRRWRRDDVVLGERIMSLYFPSDASDIVEWHKPRIAELCSTEGLERMLEWGSRIDVRDQLARVRAETLVMHAVHDGNAPIEVGRAVADSIPGARFVEVDSANHVTLANEPAWPVVVRELRTFLAPDEATVAAQAPMPKPARPSSSAIS